jgi:putative SOS response-associated peptidase YedK
MCGRYLLVSSPEAVRRLFGHEERPNFPSRYNIAPTQPVATVRLERGARRFALVRWGLVPPWTKDLKALPLLVNARAETVREKPAFRTAFRRRRCLLAADGWYEWMAMGVGKTKQPYLIAPLAGGPISFAGLWETYAGADGAEIESAAVVTVAASPALAPIHDRMPAVLAPHLFAAWLDPETPAAEAHAMLAPAPDGAFAATPVSTLVNKVANDGPDLVRPLAGPPFVNTLA